MEEKKLSGISEEIKTEADSDRAEELADDGDKNAAEEQKGEPQGSRVIKLDSGKEVVVPEDMRKARAFLVTALWILLAATIRGIGTYCFITPNGFAVGGISGIAVMLEYLTGINLGYFNLLINIPLLILAFFFLSKRYFFATTAYTLLYSAVTIAIEQLNKIFDGKLIYHDSETAIISAVFGGVMCGFAFCIMMRAGGSQGGTDIVAAIVQKKRPDIGISWVIFVIDSSIVLLSFFVYNNGLTPILLAIIESFSSSSVSDRFLKGSKSALKAEIITNHCEEISAEIFEKLGKGVTVVDAVGQYTGNTHKLLNCVIKRRQIGDLERILKKYPETFSYIMPANEVYGYWKK
ncbi:MAG: YitT family protein [Christensenellales bacterium]